MQSFLKSPKIEGSRKRGGGGRPREATRSSESRRSNESNLGKLTGKRMEQEADAHEIDSTNHKRGSDEREESCNKREKKKVHEDDEQDLLAMTVEEPREKERPMKKK